MRAFLSGLQQSVFDTPLVRRIMRTLHAGSNRRLLARLDRDDAAHRQTRTLLTLVHKARLTTFGRDHDFGRIGTPADFRRLVPLQRIADRPAPDLALLPHRRAMRVALALLQGMRLESICWLGDEPLALERFPWMARPDVFDATTLPWGPSPTCLIGPIDRVVTFAHDRRHLMPDLRAVVYSRCGSTPVECLREAVGPKPMLLESLTRPEGPIAVEDPRFDSLRLLVDAGVYFEFITATLAHTLVPTRIGLDEVQPGVPYELILTAPNGPWAGRTGTSIVFDRLDVPLLRVLTPPVPDVSERDDEPASVQAPHRSSIYTPAARPETFVHTPWSVPSDRG